MMIGLPFSSRNCLGLDLVCILRPEPPAKMTAMDAIKRGAIQILDDATIEAMKAKRARDKARDEAEKQKDAIASGEQTDWQEAMKEWNEWENSKEK